MGGVPPWGVAGWDMDVARPGPRRPARQRAPHPARPASPGPRRQRASHPTSPARVARPASTREHPVAREHPVDPAHLAHRLGATDRHLRRSDSDSQH